MGDHFLGILEMTLFSTFTQAETKIKNWGEKNSHSQLPTKGIMVLIWTMILVQAGNSYTSVSFETTLHSQTFYY